MIQNNIYVLIQMNQEIQHQKTAEDWKLEGNQAFKSKKYGKAIEAYTKAIELNPIEHSFYSNRAICLYNIGKYQQSINDCNQCLKYNPKFSKALRRKGMSQLQLLRFDQAIDTFSQALEIQNDLAIKNQMETAQNLKLNYEQYFLEYQIGDHLKALKSINYLAEKIPNNEQIKLLRVQSLAKTGIIDDALTLLKTITLGHNQNPDFWYLKGIIQQYKGDSGRAKKYFQEGLRLDPEHLKCRRSLQKAKKCELLKDEGNSLLKNEKYELAWQKYTEAINLEPSNKKLNSILYSNRALIWMKKKESMKALEDLNKSLELNPNYTKSLMRRAQINMERRQYTSAVLDYSKIESIDPNVNLKQKINQAKKLEKMLEKKDYYKILGVDKNSTFSQIKNSYKKSMLKYQFNKNMKKSRAQQNQETKKIKQLSQAYEILSDPNKRQLYDSGSMQYDTDSGQQSNIDPHQVFQMFFGGGDMKGVNNSFSGFSAKKMDNNRQSYNFKFG